MLSRKQNKVNFERNCKIENTKSYISNEIAKFPSVKVPATQYVCTYMRALAFNNVPQASGSSITHTQEHCRHYYQNAMNGFFKWRSVYPQQPGEKTSVYKLAHKHLYTYIHRYVCTLLHTHAVPTSIYSATVPYKCNAMATNCGALYKLGFKMAQGSPLCCKPTANEIMSLNDGTAYAQAVNTMI